MEKQKQQLQGEVDDTVANSNRERASDLKAITRRRQLMDRLTVLQTQQSETRVSSESAQRKISLVQERIRALTEEIQAMQARGEAIDRERKEAAARIDELLAVCCLFVSFVSFVCCGIGGEV